MAEAVRLTHLRASNWQAYPEVDLDLSGHDEIIVTGQNNHGKSALLDAITWCLYGRIGKPVDQRVADRWIRDGTQGMWVEVEFTTSDNHSVLVRREKPLGKTGALTVAVDGVTPETEHKMGDTQGTIERLIGLDYEALTAGPFMVQTQSDSFMAADPRKRKDLLISLLGLGIYDEWRDIAHKRRAVAEVVREDAKTRVGWIEEAEAALDQVTGIHASVAALRAGTANQLAEAREALTAAREALAATTARSEAYDAAVGRLASAQAAYAAATKRGTDLLASVGVLGTMLLDTHTGRPIPPPAEARSVAPGAIEDAEAAVNDAQTARDQIAPLQGKRERWADRVADADRQRAILPTVPCHGEGPYAACQFLTGIVAVEEVERAREALTRWDAEIADLQTVSQDLPARQATLRDLRSRATAIERHATSVAIYDGRLATWEAEQAGRRTLVAEKEAQLEVAKADALTRKAERDAAQAEVNALSADAALLAERRTAVRDAEGLVAELVERDREAEGNLTRAASALAVVQEKAQGGDEWRAKLAGLTEESELLGLLEAAWHRDGVPTDMIETAVPLIEARANEVLARFPQSLSLGLRTQKPVNKGKGMAETLDIVVVIHGHEREYGLLSVGARLRVDLAVRVALGELLAYRTGRSVRTLWLDEPLAPLDTEGREAVMDTLAALRDDFDLIVAVSHHPEFNDRFAARLEVVQDDEGISTAAIA